MAVVSEQSRATFSIPVIPSPLQNIFDIKRLPSYCDKDGIFDILPARSVEKHFIFSDGIKQTVASQTVVVFCTEKVVLWVEVRYFAGPDGFYFEEFSRFTKFSPNRSSSSDSVV